MKITVFGTGYVGLVQGAKVAGRGFAYYPIGRATMVPGGGAGAQPAE